VLLRAAVLAGILAACGGSHPSVAAGVVDPRPPVAESTLAKRVPISGDTTGHLPRAALRFLPVLDLPVPDGRDIVVAGTAVLDFDGDGDLDLLVPLLQQPTVLLRNDGGFQFVQSTDRLGIPDVVAYGAAVGDCDADGRTDVVLLGVDRLAVLRNLGDRFREMSDAVPPIDWRGGSALFFDAEGDGDLDLYVACYFADGGLPCPDHLLINDGSCRFTDETGARGPLGNGIGHAVGAIDLDDDGDTDLVIGNDRGFDAVPDQVLENDGTGHFKEAAAKFGLDQQAYSMSVAVADLDGDGRLDIYKGNICRSPLLLGRGPGRAYVDGGTELALPSGWIPAPAQSPVEIPAIDPGHRPNAGEGRFAYDFMQNRPEVDARCLTTWGTETADLDADGRLELLLVNGAVGQRFESALQPDQLFWRAPGETAFSEVGVSAGLADLGRGRTAVFADLDGDGRLDLVVGNSTFHEPHDGPGHVYRNITRTLGNSLFLELRGPGANRDGIGAVVEVTAGGRKQVAYRTFGASFLSGSAAPMHFGLGDATKADVVVRWPWGGGVDRVAGVAAGRATVTFGQGR
jgi:hypothetical protein